ncbi:condensation domain-containing protein [Nocardia implantans]|uniref:Condensation domain-containing protein n=1 Tax=Nocardia implantans TaxID=3108168 RepID=A0ABU6AWA5_9NOCA|nr:MULTISPECIES: condensation domain-containing protein [unclassified Nocardia]MBF6192857.1 thioester reductase [Nocardia beijingensis]MEA3531425.1 condensation domain-containing protein [Nocardia sp. CDC192]MEB3511773.1 condensation domain-containing protein [Nocardia sp. CDC186]
MSDSSVNGATTGDRGTPLSLAQQAALLPERLRRVPAANLFVALEITGELDGDAFEQAAAALLAEHEILRSVFPDDRRMPYQRVLPVPDTVVEVVHADAAALGPALHADAEHRFDLVRGLPIRIRRYDSGDRAVVSIAVHPVAADDRSLELLTEALFAAYELGTAQPATSQYRAYVATQLRALANRDAPELAYWTERLAELPERAVPVPGDATGPTRHSFTVPAATLSALRGEQETTAAFAAVLARALRDAGLGDDVLIGVIDPARTDQTEHSLGNFANHLVLRLDPTTGPRELLAVAGQRLAEARAHATARIERLTHELKGAAAVTTGALFQALLGVRAERPGIVTADFAVRETMRRSGRPHGVDLVVDVVTGAQDATVTIEFTSAFAAAGEFAAHLEALCAAFAQGRDEQAEIALFAAAAAGDGFGGPGLGGPPQTEAETLIAAAIRKVLEFDDDDEIGRADTFFALGGDSIAALRLVTELGEQGYALDVQTVFAHPSIQELASQLTDAAPAQPQTATVAPMAASGLDPAALATLGKRFGAS